MEYEQSLSHHDEELSQLEGHYRLKKRFKFRILIFTILMSLLEVRQVARSAKYKQIKCKVKVKGEIVLSLKFSLFTQS